MTHVPTGSLCLLHEAGNLKAASRMNEGMKCNIKQPDATTTPLLVILVWDNLRLEKRW